MCTALAKRRGSASQADGIETRLVEVQNLP